MFRRASWPTVLCSSIQVAGFTPSSMGFTPSTFCRAAVHQKEVVHCRLPATACHSQMQLEPCRFWLPSEPGMSGEAASQHLEVLDQVAGVLAQGATVDGLPSALQQHQLVELLEDVDGGLVDGADCTPHADERMCLACASAMKA